MVLPMKGLRRNDDAMKTDAGIINYVRMNNQNFKPLLVAFHSTPNKNDNKWHKNLQMKPLVLQEDAQVCRKFQSWDSPMAFLILS